MWRAVLLIAASACSSRSTNANDAQSRRLEEEGRRRLVAGELGPAQVYLAAAYELGDRPSLRFLLARALSRPSAIDIPAENVDAFAFSPDGALLATSGRHAGTDGVVLWNARSGKLEHAIATPAPVTAFAWQPQRTQIVIATSDGIRYWDPGGRMSLGEPVGKVRRIVWGAYPRLLLEDHTLTDLSTPRTSIALGHEPLALDGERAIVCAGPCTLVTATQRVPLGIAGATAAAIAGARIAIATSTEVRVLDDAGRERTRVNAAATAVALARDGTRLVTTGDTTRIWDAASGALLATIPTAATDVAISADGQRLATRGARMQVWDIAGEQRTPTQVSELVRCRVALALVDGRLSPATPVCTK